MNKIPSIKDLTYALQNSWNYDTASGGIWQTFVPSFNQCAVTALVVQDYYGGELLRCNMSDNVSHYWNFTAMHGEMDFTAAQFAYTHLTLVGETVIRSREYALSFPDTKRRYEILKERVAKYLGY